MKWALFSLMTATVPVVALAFLPVYGVGHHAFQAMNLYHLLNGLFTGGR
jgi:hypothetical protein